MIDYMATYKTYYLLSTRYSIIYSIDFYYLEFIAMYSKLSMKNLHTFSQDNPFVRDRSISSRSKLEL